MVIFTQGHTHHRKWIKCTIFQGIHHIKECHPFLNYLCMTLLFHSVLSNIFYYSPDNHDSNILYFKNLLKISCFRRKCSGVPPTIYPVLFGISVPTDSQCHFLWMSLGIINTTTTEQTTNKQKADLLLQWTWEILD